MIAQQYKIDTDAIREQSLRVEHHVYFQCSAEAAGNQQRLGNKVFRSRILSASRCKAAAKAGLRGGSG